MKEPAIGKSLTRVDGYAKVTGAALYAAEFGDTVQPKFGASGLLKSEIAEGAQAEVFASANNIRWPWRRNTVPVRW